MARGPGGGGWLTLRDLCDVAYVLQVEQLERRVLVERQIAVGAVFAGAKGVKVPDPDTVRAAFDRLLVEEPSELRADPDQLALRRRLRVA